MHTRRAFDLVKDAAVPLDKDRLIGELLTLKMASLALLG
jgi:hypothetical protein